MTVLAVPPCRYLSSTDPLPSHRRPLLLSLLNLISAVWGNVRSFIEDTQRSIDICSGGSLLHRSQSTTMS